MGKDKFSKNDGDRFPSDNSVADKFGSSKEENGFKNSVPEMVTLVFKQNRTKELHIGKNIYRFVGPASLKVPKSVVEHSEFENQKSILQ